MSLSDHAQPCSCSSCSAIWRQRESETQIAEKVAANVVDFQQRRGVAWDIVDEALTAYDSFMLDDDYEPYEAMKKIFGKMKERRDAYRAVAS